MDSKNTEARMSNCQSDSEAVGYIALISKLDKYIEFLDKANQGPISNAYAHGWRCPKSDIEKGQALRDEIIKLRAAI